MHDANGHHTADTDIRHLAYHLAWMIYDRYGQYGTPVNIVAHSMGGLIVRYAIARVQAHDPAFPPLTQWVWVSLYEQQQVNTFMVLNVVDFATPHDGGGQSLPRRVEFVQLKYECRQWTPDNSVGLGAGTKFIKWLNSHAQNPQAASGTDWSLVGSYGDEAVEALLPST